MRPRRSTCHLRGHHRQRRAAAARPASSLGGRTAWQFPAGAVEPGETFEEAAVRETREEVGLVVTPDRLLGERTHPKTGRRMAYVACTVLSGSAHVADADELGNIAWATPAQFDDYVPYGFAPMVQEHLAAALT